MNIGLAPDMSRSLLSAVLLVALALVIGMAGLACGNDESSSSERRSSAEREQDREDVEDEEEDNEDEQASEPSSGANRMMSGFLKGSQSGTEADSGDEQPSSEASPSTVRTASNFVDTSVYDTEEEKQASEPSPGADRTTSGFLSSFQRPLGQRSLGSEDIFRFVPAPADEASHWIGFLDILTILTDERVPDDIRTATVNSLSNLEDVCIFDIDTVVMYQLYSRQYLGSIYGRVISGKFNSDDLRGALERHGYTQETHGQYELWSKDAKFEQLLYGYNAFALPSGSAHVMMSHSKSAKDVLEALSRGSNLLSANDSDVKRLLGIISKNNLMSASTYSDNVDALTTSLTTSVSDEPSAVDISVMLVAENVQEAETYAAQAEAESEYPGEYNWIRVEAEAYENIAVVEATLKGDFSEWIDEALVTSTRYSEYDLRNQDIRMLPEVLPAVGTSVGSASVGRPQLLYLIPMPPPAAGPSGLPPTPTPTPTPLCPSRS